MSAPAGVSVQEGLIFAVHDGVELRGDLYRPAGPGPHPALVAVPGGAWLRGDRKGLQRWGEHLAARGVAVFCIDYRRSTQGAVFPQNLRDVAAAFRFVSVEAQALKLDPLRLGLLGASAGGHLAALAALAGDALLVRDGYPRDAGADLPIRPRVLVTVYGVFDLARHWTADQARAPAPGEDYTERMLGTDPKRDPDLYCEASPIHWAALASARPPVMVIWGEEDREVLPVQSQSFAAALAEAGFPVRTLPVAGATHFWFSKDEVDQPGGFNAWVAPHLERFLAEHLVDAGT